MPDTPPLVLLGAGGMLGQAMHPLLRERGEVRAPARTELDLNDPQVLRGTLVEGVQLVVNCAAYTDVDGAEKDEGAARRINGEAVATLAERCHQIGAVLLHFSTDYVFAGHATSPYRVDAIRDPINAYGRSKAVGEQALLRSPADALCVRTSWLYAPWSQNFVLTMARLATERAELRVVDDQRGRPTSAQHLAAASLALLDAGVRGLAHVTDGGACTWYELARHVVNRVHPSTRVAPCASSEFPRPAARPAYSVLDVSETERVLGPLPDWRDQVDRVLESR